MPRFPIVIIFFAFVTWAVISSYGVDQVVAAASRTREFLVLQEPMRMSAAVGIRIMRALLLSSILACFWLSWDRHTLFVCAPTRRLVVEVPGPGSSSVPVSL